MQKKLIQPDAGAGFMQYMRARPQMTALLILSCIYLLASVLIAKLFPFPFTTADTGNYVFCAETNIYGGYRPMGYSDFIRFFHGWNSSVHFVFIWQCVLNYLAVISFVFTLRYFFQLQNTVFYILSVILLLHPDILHNTNTMLSDSLFNSLSLIWITTGIWMIMRRNVTAAVLHFIVLYFAINVRYIGLFYPVISAIIILAQFRTWKYYSVMALIPVIVLVSTIQSVKKDTKEIFNLDTFSGFSGWAAANNAVSVIPYIDLKPETISDPEIKALHQLVTSFSDTCYNWYHIKDTDFMWDKEFPGKALLMYNIQQRRLPYNTAWIYTGMQWKRYGNYIRDHYPVQYFTHFMVPNIGGVFEVFPFGDESKYTPDDTSKKYFQIETESHTNTSDLFNNLYLYRVILYWAMLIAFIVVCGGIIMKRKILLHDTVPGLLMVFLAGFVFLYIAMSVYTHPIQNYRYLIPVYPVALAVIAIIAPRLFGVRKSPEA